MNCLKRWPIYLVYILITSVVLITGCDGCRDDFDEFPDIARIPGLALTVVSTDPANEERGVAINKKIAITFSEWMDPFTVATGAITVTGPDGFPVAGTATSAGLVAVFTPTANLAANGTFTVTINTMARDLAGNALKENYTFRFFTGAGPDLTAPNVVSTDPQAFARNVPLNQRISAPFNEGMDPTTINENTFFLTGPSGNRVPASIAFGGNAAITGNRVPGTVTFVGLTAIFIPASNLGFNTLYTATIKGGPNGVKDLAGNPMTDDYTWAFTGASPDTTAPQVQSTDPAHGDVAVAINKKIAFIFNEGMDPLTIKTTTFTVTGPGGAPVLGTVSYLGLIARFTPNSFLSPDTLFTARIKGGANGAKDLAGNPLGSDFSVSFTSGATPDTTPPTLASTDPANGATGVAVDKIISATFNEGMDPLTIAINTFTLRGPGGAPILGTVTYRDRVAFFAPSSSLAANTTYTAMIATGAKDLAGNALTANQSWSFRTSLPGDTTPPTVTFTDPATGAVGVAINQKIAVTFSEVMASSTITATTLTMTGPGGTPVAGTVTYSGLVALFTPAANLANNATYTGTMTTGAKDLAGNALAASYTWRFTTGAAADTTAPTVSSADPANGATGVPINKKLTITFNEGMDSTTISSTTFTVTGPGGTAVAGAVTYVGLVANFTPATSLANNATYTVTMTTGAKDLAGNALGAIYTGTFTTGAAPDTIAPTVAAADPASGAVGVATNKKLSLTFSEGMDSATINNQTFTVTGPGGTTVAGTVSYVGLIANFIPTSSLANNATYTATMRTGARDLAGNALAANFAWSFTTGAAPDTTPPTVTSTDPANNAASVATNKKVTVTFSEGMDSATINNQTFTVTGPGGTPVSGTVTYSGLIAQFVPASVLAVNATFTATMSTGAKDLAGNSLAANYGWTFTTGAAPDTTRPTVTSTDPANNAAGVPNNKKVTMTFSEGMDSSTITALNFSVTGPGGTPVAGTLTYGGLIANFTPSSNLANNATYTVKLTTGAKDLAGNALAADFTMVFTTGAAPDSIAPTVVRSDPANNATSVATNKKLSVTFSEGMDSSTITNQTFTVTGPGGTPVAGTVSYGGLIADFTPTSVLAINATYSLTITTGVKDLAGNPLAAAYLGRFTTGAAPDNTAPTVTSTDPAPGATSVAINKKITLTFNEGMDSSTINNQNFSVTGPGGTAISGTLTYSGLIAQFAPAGLLAANATYTATMTTGAKDLAGNPLAANYTMSFTTGAAPDNTAPTVTSTDPANNAPSVAINKKLTVTFSEGMDSSSITNLTFAVTGPGGTPVAGTVTYGGLIANFTPSSDLVTNATYTVTITTGAKDLSGNPLTTLYSGLFTTGAAPDTTAPTVSSTDPANNALNVATNKKITVTFSEGMDSSTITNQTVTVTGPGGTPVSGTVNQSGLIADFTPANDLAINATYTLTVTTGAKDLAGNALAANYTGAFTTGAAPDNTAPVVTSTDPANNALNVAINKKITVTFSEGMDSSTITNQTFTVTGPGGAPVSGTVNQSGLIVDFTPATDLAINSTYTITITTAARDLAGNALAAPYSGLFTTGAAPDTVRPAVTSTDPASGASSVAINKSVTVTFDEVMDSSTLNTTTFTLAGPGGTPVSGTVTYSGLIAQFVPSSDLAINATFTGTVSQGAKDLAGNALAADHTWSFTTGAAPDTLAPTVVSTDPASGSQGVAVNKVISLAFSEGMDSSTITNLNFTLVGPGGTPASGTLTYGGLNAQFMPSSLLAYNATYTATLATGAKDLAGNALASKYTWNFTTVAVPDTTPPTVTNIDPATGAVNVTVNKVIAVTFSEDVASATINATSLLVQKLDGTPATGTVSYDVFNKKGIWTPSSPLAFNTTYTVTITIGVEDLAGNNLASEFRWNFTTLAAPDSTPPTVTAFDPASGAANVAINKSIGVTFSEDMASATINATNITVKKLDGTPATGTVSYDAVTRVATWTPSPDFAFNSTYTVTIATGVQDLAGNGLAAKFTWNFTTLAAPDLVPPTVIGVYPASNAQNIGVKEAMVASFSEGMAPSSISTSTFKLAKLDGTPVLGTVTYDAINSIATFTPIADLTEVTTYSATISTGAMDLAGNKLATPTVWIFTTGQAPPNLGSATTFALMTTGAISGTPGSSINGDVGVNPAAAITIATAEVTGAIHNADQAVIDAQADLLTAYNDAVGKATNVVVMPATELGNLTLFPGLYKAGGSSFQVNAGPLTLDAQGNPNAVFIFQMPSSTLTVGVGRSVILANGAKAGNVYWQVGSSATINGGVGTTFKGNVLAFTTITVNALSNIEGRLLGGAGGGAGVITFNSSVINVPTP